MEHSGFFNAKLVDGVYDRLYNAEDYRGNLGAVISNGVRRSGDDDLKVQAVGGSMDYTVAIGRAWINGGWYFNDSTFMGTVPTSNVTLPRIDRVILRFNSNDAVRSINLAYLEGVASNSAQPPELTRTNEIYEICLAEIYVGASAVTINQSNITDTRADKDVCGWITTPVGYDDFFESIDNAMLEHLDIIDAEWQTMKDNWASVTMIKKYEESFTTTGSVTSVEVPISQFDPTGVDILEIYVNGIYVKEGTDYTRDGKIITFSVTKPIGTKIAFSVWKSIDGTGLGSVSEEVTELQNQVNDLSNLDEYRYICNGIDDNVKLSEMCSAFFDGTDDGKEIKINIYGNFVCSAPVGGDGTSTSRFRWIAVSPAGSVSRKITLDFSNCSKITVPITGGSYNIMFYGRDMTIIGVSIEATQTDTNTAMEIFSSTNGNIKAVRCRFNITGYHRTFVAENGTFDDCIATCTVMNGEGYCFYTNAEGLLRIMGGEYKAYTQSSTSNSMVVKQIDTGAVVVTYAMNCPVVSKQGYRQTHAINATGGTAIVRDTITTLTVTAGTVNSTINANKPDRG